MAVAKKDIQWHNCDTHKNNYKDIIQIPKHSLKKAKISKCAPKRPRHTFQELVKSDQARARKIPKISNEGCFEMGVDGPLIKRPRVLGPTLQKRFGGDLAHI